MRRYSSADKPAQRDAATATAALEWLPLPIALAATPGMHRFVWPLHHGAPAALAGGDAFADGVLALPGNYTIELSVDDAIYTHPLIVLPDPRIKLPAQAYVEQFELARHIESLRAQLASAAQPLTALQTALSARLANADDKTRAWLDPFQAKLIAVTGTVPSTNPSNSWWLPPKTFTSVRFLDSQLSALDSAVSDADARPSADSRTGVALAQARLPSVLDACTTLQNEDLAHLNRKLVAAGQAPLEVTFEVH